MSQTSIHRDTRSDIIVRSKEMFVERGYDAVSMEDIASAVGIKKASLYHFYKNKDELYVAVIRDIVEVIIPKITAALDAGCRYAATDTARARTLLRKIMLGFIEHALQHGTVIRDKEVDCVKHACPHVAELHGQIKQIEAAFIRFFRHFHVPQPVIAYEIIAGSMHAYVARRKHGQTTVTPRAYVDYLTGVIIR